MDCPISRKVLLLYFIVLVAQAYAETVNIRYQFVSGNYVEKEYPADIKHVTISDSMFGNELLEYIDNLDKLTGLDTLELINLPFIKSYDFLKKVPWLRKLSMQSCTVSSLRFLEDMVSLEVLDLNIYIPGEIEQLYMQEVISLSRLSKLKLVKYFSGKLPGIPRFVNIRSKPVLSLRNQTIISISYWDKYLLYQYSVVDLLFVKIEDKTYIQKLLPSLILFFNPEDVTEDIEKLYKES